MIPRSRRRRSRLPAMASAGRLTIRSLARGIQRTLVGMAGGRAGGKAGGTERGERQRARSTHRGAEQAPELGAGTEQRAGGAHRQTRGQGGEGGAGQRPTEVNLIKGGAGENRPPVWGKSSGRLATGRATAARPTVSP